MAIKSQWRINNGFISVKRTPAHAGYTEASLSKTIVVPHGRNEIKIVKIPNFHTNKNINIVKNR